MTSPSETSGKSPLSEADPSSLDELFARDPLDLTKDDLDSIASELRDHRGLWIVADEQAKDKKTSTPRGKSTPVPEGGINLDDLDLGV